jgi:hypothetical protein
MVLYLGAVLVGTLVVMDFGGGSGISRIWGVSEALLIQK